MAEIGCVFSSIKVVGRNASCIIKLLGSKRVGVSAAAGTPSLFPWSVGALELLLHRKKVSDRGVTG
jgi:hypothetical protein